jgi:hypothetical protein
MAGRGGLHVSATVAEFLALLALMAAFFMGGYLYRGDRDRDAMLASAHDAGACASSADASAASLKALQVRFDDLKKRHDDALAAATAALKQRDDDVAALSADAEKRTGELRRLTRDRDDCKPLASLGICAAVADELWPVPKQAAAAAAAH